MVSVESGPTAEVDTHRLSTVWPSSGREFPLLPSLAYMLPEMLLTKMDGLNPGRSVTFRTLLPPGLRYIIVLPLVPSQLAAPVSLTVSVSVAL